jgi:hypothetical protein
MINLGEMGFNVCICAPGRTVIPTKPHELNGDELDSLWAAADRGEVSTVTILQGGTQPPPVPRGPCVLIVGDDPEEGGSKGPDAFPTGLRDYLREASGVGVYSGIGAGSIYDLFLKSTKQFNRPTIIIQTQVEHHDQWLAFVKRLEPDMPMIEAHPDRGMVPVNIPDAPTPGASRQQRRASERKQRKGR